MTEPTPPTIDIWWYLAAGVAVGVLVLLYMEFRNGGGNGGNGGPDIPIQPDPQPEGASYE